MCLSQPSPPPPPPPPAPLAPTPVATVAPADGARKDSQYLSAGKGRNSLRIDKTISGSDASGSGLNIPS